ncbi:phasin family protein [Aestuariibacter sp. A3R04]|uniref:phasin family protein n=1 Tax=Aestuariibacter sp. A3R04 TaxID=2841571 RepID=UPI001C08685C|nr:phasin family protein [Aestuariibacter sp. A3R04]MBU3020761.1 phasin family protein [Aestuariibacter sp. A3R04]
MFEQMNEQIKTAMKPMSDLASLNMSTMQELAEKQNSLYKSLLSEGMSYFEKASQQKDLMSLADANKAYAESVQEKVSDVAKSSYEVLTEAQQKAGEMFKSISDEMTAKFQDAAKA